MKRFVILEDSSLAKGVRRIVAITGEESFQVFISLLDLTNDNQAQRLADIFDQQLSKLSQLEGLAFETALKETGKVSKL